MISRLFKRDVISSPAVVAGRWASATGSRSEDEVRPLEPAETTQPVNNGELDVARILGGGFRGMPLPRGLQVQNGEFALLTNGTVVVGLRRNDVASSTRGYFFSQHLRKAIPHALVLDVTSAEMRQIEALQEGVIDVPRASINSTPQQVGQDLIGSAMAIDASDVHIDIDRRGPFAPSVHIRFRQHDELFTHKHLKDAQSLRIWDEVVRSLFQDERAGVSTERNTSILSDTAGRFYRRLQLPLKNAELRFEADTTNTGVKTVIRILTYDGKPTLSTDLLGLGLAPSQSDAVLQAFDAPHGMILAMGATGDGKTTLIATALGMHRHPERQCRVGMEQPPEISIPFMSQLQFAEDNFRDALRGALRLDPDVIYAGEINNPETAVLAMQAAMTGHLVPASLHGNNVEAGLSRLVGSKGMGVPLEDLCAEGVLRLLEHQTLVPTLCEQCRELALPHLASSQIAALEALDVDPMGTYVRFQGPTNTCLACQGRGIQRRTAIAEVVQPTADFRQALLRGGVMAAMEVHRGTRTAGFADEDQVGKSAVEHGLYKASRGEICVKNLYRMYDFRMHPVAQARRGVGAERQRAEGQRGRPAEAAAKPVRARQRQVKSTAPA